MLLKIINKFNCQFRDKKGTNVERWKEWMSIQFVDDPIFYFFRNIRTVIYVQHGIKRHG